MGDIDWERTVLVLVGPDALARHLGVEIVSRLGGIGFVPVGWKVLWQRPIDLDAFHEKNITQVWQAYLYRLVDRLFAFGPTVAVLVEDEDPVAGVSSHDRLRRAKGASEPANALAGTIRADLESVNAMLALMHSADTPADSQRESAVFAGPGGFDRGDPAELTTLLGLLELAGSPERRGYDAVLAGVRARTIATLWDQLPATARDRVRIAQDKGVPGLAAPELGAELVGLLPSSHHPLVPVLRCEFNAGSPGVDIDQARCLLRAYGTDLDPWEDLVLATSMRFAPRRTGR
ncbi:MAG: nucleoside-diphosphate kinase [Actinobacteria bacterium]|nr:nucleoside-diphosphate kinase [Actinomycetota bacterium]